MAVNRNKEGLIGILGGSQRINIDLIIGKSRNILLAFENVGIHILDKGELENYYNIYSLNQYNVEDAQKTNAFIKERDFLFGIDPCQINTYYPEITTILDKICCIKNIDMKKYTSVSIGDWLHLLQRAIAINENIDVEAVKKDITIQYDIYNRLFDIVTLEKDKINKFKCVIKLKKSVDPKEQEIVLYGTTVPANIKL